MTILSVVVTYNGEKWIERCLGSLKESTVPIQPMAIDNGSSDNTLSIIENHFPEVHLIKSNENLGFGKANNIGLKEALKENYDYAFLLNQDAWIEPDTIETLLNLHQNYPEYGIISPMHLNKEKTSLDNKFTNYICRSQNAELISDLLLPLRQRNAIYEIDFVNAAAWLIPKACLKIVGGFDPLFLHYGEDNDFINRAKFYGFKIGFTPNTSIVHDREGYVKQPDMHRSFAKQYTDRLRTLKNIQLPFRKTFFSVMKEEIYYAISSLLKLDVTMFFIKLRLISRIFSQKSAIQKSRKYCINNQTAYLN